MALNRVCVIIDVFVEVFLEVWIFVQAYGSRRKWGKEVGAVIAAGLFLWFSHNSIVRPVLLSTSDAIFDIPIYTFGLWIITGGRIDRIFAWCLFCFLTYTLIKLPVLVLSGLIYGMSLSEHLIGNVHSWAIFNVQEGKSNRLSV